MKVGQAQILLPNQSCPKLDPRVCRVDSIPFQYQTILVIGATSGIGLDLANRFVAESLKMSAVGRRKEWLEKFVHKHGHEKEIAVPFDITELDKIPNFAIKYVEICSLRYEVRKCGRWFTGD